MKEFQGIWMPDTEQELIDWMTRNGQMVDGKGTYQYAKIEATLRNCRSFRRCVEQGSHIGLWTMHLMQRFDYMECFEPVSRLRECWFMNITNQDRTRLYPMALGSEPGQVRMLSNLFASGDSYLDEATEKRNIQGHTATVADDKVERRTIDSFQFNDVDLIKLDAEGYEEIIARGAEQTIRRWRPTIVIEQKRDMACKFGLKPQGGVEYLKSLGYRVADMLAGDYVMVPA
jgi:FkbM family methyltransferase